MKGSGIIIKKAIGVCISFLISFFVVNGLMFIYERPVAWIDTPNGASYAIRNPSSLLVHGTEGYAFSKIDENGYINQLYPANNEYVLMMGSSHSQGKEVSTENRYSSIVNSELTGGKKELHAYNIACDGHFLPTLIKHFKSAVTCYPNATCVTIEIGSTDYSLDELKDSLNQPQNIDSRSAKEIFSEQSSKSKIKNMVKEIFPLLSMIQNHLQTASAGKTNGERYPIDEDDYKNIITGALKLIRSEYEGDIVFVYHPSTVIENDGSLSIVRSETIGIFKNTCADIGIDFIDVGDAFLNHYDEYHELPYGFSNTSPGKGHLNEVGHQIMADAILDYLAEVNPR